MPRRLPAEVAYDAIQMAMASDAKAATMRTDLKNRAIAIPGASAQNQGNRGGKAGLALRRFGPNIRQGNCDWHRSLSARPARGGWVPWLTLDRIARGSGEVVDSVPSAGYAVAIDGGFRWSLDVFGRLVRSTPAR